MNSRINRSSHTAKDITRSWRYMVHSRNNYTTQGRYPGNYYTTQGRNPRNNYTTQERYPRNNSTQGRNRGKPFFSLEQREKKKIEEKMKMALKANPSVPKNAKHWSMGLLESMKNPAEIFKETESVVVIRDKFPKAKVHYYLVLPKTDISTIHQLNKTHIGLLKEFGKLYEEIQRDHKGVKLRAGFHAIPSMYRVHMHLISTDMISERLKTKTHWNSFTTKYFIPYEDVLEQLETNGSVTRMSAEEVESVMNTPLVCNQCSHRPKNMPQLKQHLLTHSK